MGEAVKITKINKWDGINISKRLGAFFFFKEQIMIIKRALAPRIWIK